MFGRLGSVSQYSSLINAAASRYGVEPGLLAAVIQNESGGNPNAVSSAGAQGLMQLMPGTAASLGVTKPFDPAQNIDAGARYLSQMIHQFGDVPTALAAYNWGPGNVASGGPIPSDVQAYVASVLGQAGTAASPVPVFAGGAGGGATPLVDLSGAAAATPTADILSQVDTSVANVFGTDSSTGGLILLGIGAVAAIWLAGR